MKNWLYKVTKIIVNDCSVGMFLIVIGFLLGWMSQSIFTLISSIVKRF